MQFIAVSTLAIATLAAAAPTEATYPSPSPSQPPPSNNSGKGQCSAGQVPAERDGNVYCCQTSVLGLINLNLLNCVNLEIPISILSG